MSEIVGSCSSGSSGPRPNTSSSTSSEICCFSNELSSVGSLSISEMTACRTSVADALVVDRRERLKVDLVEQLAMKRELQLLVFGLQRAAVLRGSLQSRCSQESCWLPCGAGLESNVGSMKRYYSSGMRQQRADRKTALRLSWLSFATPISLPARLSTARPNSESLSSGCPSATPRWNASWSFGKAAIHVALEQLGQIRNVQTRSAYPSG